MASVVHFFEAPSREAAQRCVQMLNENYEAGGGAASFAGAELDLTDPEFTASANPYQVVFEHEAVVDEDYVSTVHDMETVAQACGVEYGGWHAEEE